MLQGINCVLVRIARIACIVFLMAGCASVTKEADQSPSPSFPGSGAATDRTPSGKSGSRAGNQAQAKQNFRRQTPLQIPTPADGSLPTVELSASDQWAQAIDLTYESDDIFQRMRNGFSMPDINSDLVLYHQQWYMNRPESLRRITERSSLYLFYIVEELEKRGMPMELALLPMVESAYNPMAYSRAKASGLWQFIPATGKRYNLDQNWWKDERRDILASTTAALDYLQSIYDMHGDWHLALASYNWGEGAVGRAVNKNVVLGLPTDYLSLTMPGETRNYVPKLQALKNIFSNPALLIELRIPRIPNRPYFGTVTKTSNIDVKVAARLADMPVQEFVALNPAHNRPVIKSETPMVIPAHKLETFITNLEAHEESNKPLSSWQSYTVRPGDKLEKIAPRFGMTVANLREANGITGRIKVSPGHTLLVAGNNGGEPLNMAALPEQPSLPQADPVSPGASSAATVHTHTVRKGETLPVIARRYGTSVADLKRINHLRSDRIAAGTRLEVGTANKTAGKGEAKPGKAGDSPKKMASAQKSPKTIHYTVRRGDTLASIARHFKVGKDDLLRWNRISPNALTPGKSLTIQLSQNP
ncbi:MAG: LysM peptidoglycan-binding domain-containing protein [Propionivibrio sp.]|nr:LysM peptidoglycan-binding domain-containing protein [Propionivibrio sp.]